MPDKINLDSSGLRRSARSAVLSRQEKVYSHSTMVLKSVKRSSKHACLVLFTSFCAIGAALNGGVHSHQVLAQSSSLLSNAIDSYHRVNSLYDGTINCFSTLAQSSVTSNETFNYKEALQQSDKIEFIKAMVHEVDDHETRKHWTLMKRCVRMSDCVRGIEPCKCKGKGHRFQRVGLLGCFSLVKKRRERKE
jgi:predicted Zn-ribbon and HTH transcriptional regulator